MQKFLLNFEFNKEQRERSWIWHSEGFILLQVLTATIVPLFGKNSGKEFKILLH